eukprot:16382040-Heterocapsa_arctica.AAC.1
MKKDDGRQEVKIAEFVQELNDVRIVKEKIEEVCHVQEVGHELMVLVDSGAYTHVCPKSFASLLPMRRSTSGREALTADGRPLRRYGESDVTL